MTKMKAVKQQETKTGWHWMYVKLSTSIIQKEEQGVVSKWHDWNSQQHVVNNWWGAAGLLPPEGALPWSRGFCMMQEQAMLKYSAG